MRALILAVVLACGACLVKPSITINKHVTSPRLTPESAARAFQQGIEAAALGQPISACPYSGEDAVRAWKAGWRWWTGA